MRSYFPNEDDVTGSAQAIMRLQDTYKLDVHEIAQGVVKGTSGIEQGRELPYKQGGTFCLE